LLNFYPAIILIILRYSKKILNLFVMLFFILMESAYCNWIGLEVLLSYLCVLNNTLFEQLAFSVFLKGKSFLVIIEVIDSLQLF